MCVVESSSAQLVIKNRLGLHARAAAKLAKAAGEYQADIRLINGDGAEADARSVLSLISLGCDYDSQVTIAADGIDARRAISALSGIIEDRFGED